MCNILLPGLWFTILFSELLNTCSTSHVLLFITIQDQCTVLGCFIFMSCMHLTFNATNHGKFLHNFFSMLLWWVISSERSAYLLTLASSNHHCNSVQILLGTIICALLFWWVISSER